MLWLRRAATFLRLVDEHDKLLSLTNLALIVCIVKLAWLHNVSLPDLGAFFLGLLSYSWKRHGKAQAVVKEERIAALETLTDGLDTLKQKVVALDNRTKGRASQ
jgi:hypothetical protein